MTFSKGIAWRYEINNDFLLHILNFDKIIPL